MSARRALVRALNEEIVAIAGHWNLGDIPLPFHCECGRASCEESAALRPSDYVRATQRVAAVLLARCHQEHAGGAVIEHFDDAAAVALVPLDES